MTINLKKCTGCNTILSSDEPDICMLCDQHSPAPAIPERVSTRFSASSVCPVCGQETHRSERYPDCMHYPSQATAVGGNAPLGVTRNAD